MSTVLTCLQCGRDNLELGPRCVSCGAVRPAHATPVTADPRAGKQLGRYRLLRRLGAGGMGVVYEAREGDAPVAVKLIAPALAAREDIRVRFQREARVASALHHEHIGEVHRLEEIGDDCLLVMPLYQGETVQARLARGPLPVAEALEIAAAVASGLAAAHRAGVIHRDIKPGNVFLTADGGVRILDFGLAKHIDPDPAHTQSSAGAVVGTPAYMAPEQLAGGELDARVDAWGLGVLLYEMLEGRPPFGPRGGRPVGADPAPLRDAPPFVAELVTALLQRAPAARPDMASVLVRLRERHAPRRRRRRRMLAAAMGVTVAAAAALALPVHARRARDAEYERAMHALALVDPGAAIARLEPLLRDHPDFTAGWSALARARLQRIERTRARAAVAQALQHLDPADRAHRLELEGLQAAIDGDFATAIDRYQACYRFFPSSLEIGLALADAQMTSGKAQDALVTLEPLRAAEDDPRVLLAQARAFGIADNFQRALDLSGDVLGRAGGMSSAAQAAALLRHGIARGHLGEPAAGLAELAAARVLFELLHDPMMVGRVYNGITLVRYAAGDTQGALAAADQELVINRAAGDAPGLVASLTNVASIVADLGQLPRSRQLFEEAFVLMRDLQDDKGLANTLISYGVVLSDAGDLVGASKALREAAALGRTLKNDKITAIALSDLGAVEFSRGDLKASEAARRETIRVATHLGDPRTLAIAESGLATALDSEGDYPAAIRAQEEAVQHIGEAKDATLVAVFRRQLAGYMTDHGDHAAALPILLDVAATLHRASNDQEEVVARALLAVVLAELGRRAEARAAIASARKLLTDDMPVDPRAVVAIDLARAAIKLGDLAQARQLLAIPLAPGVAPTYVLDHHVAEVQLAFAAHAPSAEPQRQRVLAEARHLGLPGVVARELAALR